MASGTYVDDGGWSLFLQVAVTVERLGNVWSWVRGDVTDGDDTGGDSEGGTSL